MWFITELYYIRGYRLLSEKYVLSGQLDAQATFILNTTMILATK